MDETLTRLAFRVQGGDLEAARALLVEAEGRQLAAGFERAAKALYGSESVLSLLETRVAPEVRARVRELLPSPLEAATTFTPAVIDLEALDEIGPAAMLVVVRWAIDALHHVPRYGTALPYLGASLAGTLLHVVRKHSARVEAPWVTVRAVALVDPTKKPLTDALVRGYFTAFGERAAAPVLAVLANEAPPARRALWSKLLIDDDRRVDDLSLCTLLDDAPLRELALEVLVRRGPSAAKQALPFLHASAPGTRRAVATLLAATSEASAIPALRQAIARERDARTRVQMTSALEKLSGAEPMVPKTSGDDAAVSRSRAELTAPRQPKPPAWLAAAEIPRLDWRDGEPLTRAEIDVIVGRLAQLRTPEPLAFVPDLRNALARSSARTLFAALRAAFVASRERPVFPDWLLRAIAQLSTEHDVDLACEEIDATLRTSASERWRRGPGRSVELAWDPDAIAGSPTRSSFAWLLHWAETAPKRRDRERAQKALAIATRAVPEGERSFAVLRRFGLDDEGTCLFEEDGEQLVVRVHLGGAIDVASQAGEPVLRLPPGELGRRVLKRVAELEAALLDARRTLAEAYADKLVVDVGFARDFLLIHPLWRPIAQGCVVRLEDPHAPRQTLRLAEEAISGAKEGQSVRFVLAQVDF